MSCQPSRDGARAHHRTHSRRPRCRTPARPQRRPETADDRKQNQSQPKSCSPAEYPHDMWPAISASLSLPSTVGFPPPATLSVLYCPFSDGTPILRTRLDAADPAGHRAGVQGFHRTRAGDELRRAHCHPSRSGTRRRVQHLSARTCARHVAQGRTPHRHHQNRTRNRSRGDRLRGLANPSALKRDAPQPTTSTCTKRPRRLGKVTWSAMGSCRRVSYCALDGIDGTLRAWSGGIVAGKTM